MKFRRCDNCGKFNPKRLYGEDRLCGESPCAHPKGFYKRRGWELGTDGKVYSCRIQFPLVLKWRGFFSF